MEIFNQIKGSKTHEAHTDANSFSSHRKKGSDWRSLETCPRSGQAWQREQQVVAGLEPYRNEGVSHGSLMCWVGSVLPFLWVSILFPQRSLCPASWISNCPGFCPAPAAPSVRLYFSKTLKLNFHFPSPISALLSLDPSTRPSTHTLL